MTAHALLAAHTAKRQHPRYILKRRGLMATQDVTVQIRTLDVSEQGFGIIAEQPIQIGKTYSISFDIVVGNRIATFNFACTAVIAYWQARMASASACALMTASLHTNGNCN